jgi:hypothetical protein
MTEKFLHILQKVVDNVQIRSQNRDVGRPAQYSLVLDIGDVKKGGSS